MEKEFSDNYDPKQYEDDPRFVIALKEAKFAQLLYFIPTILTIILIYALSPKMGEEAKLLFGFPAWYTVTGILWLVVFVIMLLHIKFGVKTVSFDARIDSEKEE